MLLTNIDLSCYFYSEWVCWSSILLVVLAVESEASDADASDVSESQSIC